MSTRLCLLLLALWPGALLADHPLITEDTGVLGKGVRQIEIHGARTRDRQGDVTRRTTDVSAVLGYGLADTADLQLELPYIREVTDGEVVKGRGDASVALKWRFLDKEPLSMVLKPEILLPTGRDELGLGAGRTRWALNFAAAYELGRLEAIAHVGYLHNLNRLGEPKSVRHRSLALLWSATETLQLVLDRARDEVVYGLTYALNEAMDLGVGIKKGLNDAAEDRALLAGVKVRW